MFLQKKKLVLGGVMLVVVVLLVACDFGGNSGNGTTGTGSTQHSTTVATITPQLVTPKAASGSAGKGPLVISSATPMPGGKVGSEQVVLGDRTLIINNASKQQGASTNTTLINLDLAVQNTSGQAIMNQSSFFRLIGSEGDTFSYQYNSSDNFYGTIAVRTTRSGTIVFQVPAFATSSLHLLYRPEIGTETVITSLILSR